jgi:hypothetical protein
MPAQSEERMAPVPLARGSFGGCPSDCTQRHEGVTCDSCGVPWDLHLRAFDGHGCNDLHKRGSFQGCDKDCTATHEGVLCDKCHGDWGWHAGHVCTPTSGHATSTGPASSTSARGSFGGCPSDCTQRHRGVSCDSCGVPWELHSRAFDGHGCNDRHKRGSFQGCDKDCTATHEGELCDKCHEDWGVHQCGHYCSDSAESGRCSLCVNSALSRLYLHHQFPNTPRVDVPDALRQLLRGALEDSSVSRGPDGSVEVSLPGHLLQVFTVLTKVMLECFGAFM